MRRGMRSVEGWLGVLLAAVVTVASGRVADTRPKLCEGAGGPVSCYSGEVRPCKGSVKKASETTLACARSFYVFEEKPGAEPTSLAGSLELHGCGGLYSDKGCQQKRARSLFDDRTHLRHAIQVLKAVCATAATSAYLCAPMESQDALGYTHPVTGTATKEEYASITCVCSSEKCNMQPQRFLTTRYWLSNYSEILDNSSNQSEAIDTIIEDLKLNDITGRDWNGEEAKLMRKSYHPPLEYRDHSLNNTGAACPIAIYLEFNNCFEKEVRNADFLSVIMESQLKEWQKTGSCVGASWCWDLRGELLTNLSGVEYRLDFKISACSNLLHHHLPWAFLALEDVNTSVIEPCNRLLPSQPSHTPDIDYKNLGKQLHIRRNHIYATFRPTANLTLTCYRAQEGQEESPSAGTTDLKELKRQLWIALIVWLVQIAIAALLLPLAIFNTDKTDDYIHDYRGTMGLHLIPFLQYNAMPDNLVETFLELHILEEEAEDYKETRSMINDHHRASTYNFFGWRTDFDYRPFPCLGEPPAAAAETKCECPECKHVKPSINLTKLISPSRLIQMGLKDRALVDRKDPLYDTYLALKTNDYLPKDPRSKDAGSGAPEGSGDPPSVSPKLIDHHGSDRSTQPLDYASPPSSDKSTLPTLSMSVHKAPD